MDELISRVNTSGFSSEDIVLSSLVSLSSLELVLVYMGELMNYYVRFIQHQGNVKIF